MFMVVPFSLWLQVTASYVARRASRYRARSGHRRVRARAARRRRGRCAAHRLGRQVRQDRRAARHGVRHRDATRSSERAPTAWAGCGHARPAPAAPRPPPSRTDRGQAVVELALTFPFIVLLLLAIIQLGLVVRDQILVVHASREAARVGAVDPDPNAPRRAAVGSSGLNSDRMNVAPKLTGAGQVRHSA